MENEYDIYANFIGNEISIKQSDDAKVSGTLVSIDGYLNLVLINGKYTPPEITDGKSVSFNTLFVRGTVIDYISKF